MTTGWAIFPDLVDKKILVTGASRGIGKEIAIALAHQKAHVIFNYRNQEKADQLLAELKELDTNNVTTLKFDLNDEETMKSALEGFTKEHGAIQGLVNNAGISKDNLLMRLKKDEIDDVIDTNLKGSIRLTQILSRNFLRAQDVSIVNISSVVGLMGNAGQSIYAASKAGLIGFTKSVAKELAAKQIRCNAVCPGFIETDMTNQLDEKTKEEYLKSIPLKSFGKTEDVANLVCFLLSNSSSYITGEVIKIDGGMYI